MFDPAYKRNILAHEYYNLTGEDLFDISRRIPAVRKFVEQIKESIFDSDI